MNVRRATGIAMLIVEVALLRIAQGYLPAAILITVLALVGCVPRFQVSWGLRRRILTMSIAGAAFYLAFQLDLLKHDPFRSTAVENPASVLFALYFMTLQAIQFYWRVPGGLPLYYPLLGILALSHASDQYLSGPDATVAFGCAMAFGVFAALFYAAGLERHDARRPRWLLRRSVISLLCLLLSLGLASGTAIGLKEGDTIMAQWMANRALMEKLGLGNNPQARLNSITDLKSRDSDRIVLQIEAAASPGYLRGQAYADYQNDTWLALPFGESMPVANRTPEGYRPLWPDAKLYEIPPLSGPAGDAITLFPSPEIEHAIFTPLEIAWLGYRGRLQMNEARVLQSTAVSHGQPYQLWTAPRAGVEPLSEAEREKYTRLPSSLAPRIQSLSDSICAGRTDNLSKAGAVAQYFTGSYAYTLGIQVPDGEDPLAYFLFSDPLPAAHCEFFATGAALLLRAAGVPARYVTGVGVWEQHPFADYWVARNRDAHAWVEAWDEKEGWFIVEATPASGLPEASLGRNTSALRDLWSLVTLQVRQFLAALRDGAWRVAVEALAAMLGGLYQFVQEAWLTLVLGLVLFIVVLRLLRYRKHRPVRHLPQCVIARRLHRQLGLMDRTMKRRHRLERAAHMTPHAFAQEIETVVADAAVRGPLATWYRRWAEVRYQPVIDGADVDRLEQGLRALKRRKRK